MKECCVLSSAFCTSIEVIIWFLSFILLKCQLLTAYIETSLHTQDESHSIMMNYHLNVLLNSIHQYCAEDFISSSSDISACSSHFLLCLSLVLVSGQYWQVWKYFFLKLLEQSEQNCYQLFFQCLAEFSSENTRSWRLFTTVSILLMLFYLSFGFLHCSILVCFMCLRIHPFLLSFPIYCIQLLIIVSKNILNFCDIRRNDSFFIPDFIYMDILSFTVQLKVC